MRREKTNSQPYLDRLPPQAVEVEQAVLGAMLLDGRAVVHALGSLTADDFYHGPHARIFSALLDCHRYEGKADPLAVEEYLKGQGNLAEVGGLVYLSELLTGVASWANVDIHCKIVKAKAVARRGIEKAAALMSALYESEGMDADQIVRQYGGDLLQGLAAEGLDVGAPVGESVEAAERSYEAAQERYRAGIQFAGIDSGFDCVNRSLNGICPEEMTSVGARPSIGKTTCAWEIGLTVAHQGFRVAGFPLESSKAQTGRLLTRLVGGLHAERFRKGALTEAEEAIRLDAQEKVRLLPITLFDRKPITPDQLRASMLHLEARHHVDLWIIDYLQLVQCDGSDAQLNQITSALRSLSLSLHTHILLLSQLSRRPEDRNDKRPSLSDLRGCIPGNQRVLTADGAWVPMMMIKVGDRVAGLSREHEAKPTVVKAKRSTGFKTVLMVQTKTGREVRLTANHPLLTPLGWKAAGKIGKGDEVATAWRTDESLWGMPERSDLCRLLGYMIGDGSYKDHRAISFVSGDNECFADVVGIVRKHFPEVALREKPTRGNYVEGDFVQLYPNGWGRPYGNSLREWMRGLGIIGQDAWTKRVPQFVFESGQTAIGHFMAGYLSSDGCVKTRVRRGTYEAWSVHFDSVNRELLRDVQLLLIHIGVVAAIGKPSAKIGRSSPIFRLSLAEDRDNLHRFASVVPARGKRGGLLRKLARQALVATSGSDGIFSLPVEVSARLETADPKWRHQGKRMRRSTARSFAIQHHWLRKWAHGDVLWEKVVEIKACCEEEVFDIETGTGNFFCEGILVHNSGGIEQDSVNVILLHRPGFYPELMAVARKRAEQGKDPNAVEDLTRNVEFIFAKTREGPTGSTLAGEVEWDADTASFYDRRRRQAVEQLEPSHRFGEDDF